MTSATERLRALLDERGVEYTTDDKQVVRYTDWGCWFFAEPLGAEPNTLGAQCELVCMPVTPEQAIDATLGPGTCHAVFEVDAMSGDERIGEFVCSECGETFNDGHGEFPHYCPNCGRKVVG